MQSVAIALDFLWTLKISEQTSAYILEWEQECWEKERKREKNKEKQKVI